MKKKWLAIAIALGFIALFALVVVLYRTKDRVSVDVQADYSGYVSAYTSGLISKNSVIQVIFPGDMVSPDKLGEALSKRILKIKPSVSGTLTWTDPRTLTFTPEDQLTPDKEYVATLALDRLYDNLPDELEELVFSFRVLKQAMEVELLGLEFYEDLTRKERRLAGTVNTADAASAADIASVLKASLGGEALKVTWDSNAELTQHRFWIEGVLQTDAERTVTLTWNGKPIGADYSEETSYTVPPKGNFELLDTRVVQTPEQYVEIRFSEPIDPRQVIDGLVTIQGVYDLRLVSTGNILRVYPASRLNGQYNLEIADGLRGVGGKRIERIVVIPLQFEVLKPAVKLVGNGTILPSSNGLLFPFQAVSLRAVDVMVERIFANNIVQFMQVNSLSDGREIRRVGRLVLRKTVLLNSAGSVDYAVWNSYSIDLSKMIRTEPGAIYRVTLSFKKEYSVYPCDGVVNDAPIAQVDERYSSDDDSHSTYYYDDYYDDDYYYYDWKERDNPCNSSYYYNKSVTRNVLASDLGLIAKRGNDGSLLFAVTDIVTANPLSGVKLSVYNYQNQVIAQAETNSEGLASMKIDRPDKPFLLVASNGEQRGYLKLDDGSSLSLSAFDVSGQAVQKGIKGYIYGERGVWRPGDTLFVSFILEDRLNTLPASHPISFEVLNPRGQMVHKSVVTSSEGGVYAFVVPTDQSALTGTYTARVKVGGVVFTSPLRVETIMPNRLKLALDFGVKSLSVSSDVTGKLTAAWLHGAPARNLKAKVDVVLSPARTSFDDYQGYVFDDPTQRFEAEEQTVYSGNLNAEGVTNFSPDINVSDAAAGMLRANFTVRVFEEGGGFSIDRFTMPYSPYNSYVGVKLPEPGTRYGYFLTDTSYVVNVATVDNNGKPISRSNLTVSVFKLGWSWWWERSSNDLSDFNTSRSQDRIFTTKISTAANGKGTFNLKIDQPAWGQFLILVSDSHGGHSTGTVAYFDWPGWVKRDANRQKGSATMLAFSSDKNSYKVGETATLTIPTAAAGRVFVSVENGGGVLKTHWVEATAGETRFSFPVTGDMAPNVYVYASYIQPHSKVENDLPIRMYGIIPIMVEDPATHIKPVIVTDDEFAPEKEVTIKVSEEKGKPMTFTLAVVDDGLLDLTRFRTPDPWSSFYAREALGVKTWDLYDMVMGANAGRMQRIITIGGDEDLKDSGERSANRFKPVVRFFGPYSISKGGKEKVTFTMPNYIGSVRVMVVGAHKGAYGSADKTVPVRKPLMVLATLPRVLGPDEEVMLPVTVFAMDKKVKDVSVSVSCNDLLSPIGDSKQSVKFDAVGDKVVRFNLKVAKRLGIARVKVEVKSGRETASHEIELDVRNPNPPITLVSDTLLKAGQKWAQKTSLPGVEGTNSAVVELSSLPPLDIKKRLGYLIEYPHGCLEQTTSKAFPQLMLGKVTELSQEDKLQAEANVKAALGKLRSFLTPWGGLALWPGSTDPDSWASTYAGHFMIEAQAQGYTLPVGLLDTWLKYQRQSALAWKPALNYYNDDLMQAYRLYTLALARKPEVGAMNRLREYPKLSNAARWRLAAAYALAGNPEAAKELANKANFEFNEYRELYYTYGSALRDKAMIVESLVLMGMDDKAFPLLKDISNRFCSDSWLSTQETSFGLLAFAKYAGKSKSDGKIDAVVTIKGKDKSVSTSLPVMQTKFEPSQGDKVAVENKGKGALYTRLIVTGQPVVGDQLEVANIIALDVTYRLMNGVEVDPASLAQGTDFYADIQVRNPGSRGNLQQLTLSFIVPSGWEIRNTRMDNAQALQSSSYTYQDIRDDRVYTYFDIRSGETKSFKVILNSSYIGKYYMPSVSCEAMYDNSINARFPGKWVNVVMPQ